MKGYWCFTCSSKILERRHDNEMPRMSQHVELVEDGAVFDEGLRNARPAPLSQTHSTHDYGELQAARTNITLSWLDSPLYITFDT